MTLAAQAECQAAKLPDPPTAVNRRDRFAVAFNTTSQA
jgi:hypothetical protein